MAALATQSIKRTGLNPAYAACSVAGDTCVPGSHTFLHVKNTGGAPLRVTVAAKAVPLADMKVTDLTDSVTNAQERMIGPINPAMFADPAANGVAQITYPDGVANLSIGVFELTQP